MEVVETFVVEAGAVEVALVLKRQMFSLYALPQMLFASPAHAMEQSESAVLALAGGALEEHQHSRPYDAPNRR